MATRHAFIVGRSTRRGTTVLLLCSARSPILGPWTIRAVVSAN